MSCGLHLRECLHSRLFMSHVEDINRSYDSVLWTQSYEEPVGENKHVNDKTDLFCVSFCFQAKQWPTLEDMPSLAVSSCSLAFGWQSNTSSFTTGGRAIPKCGTSCRRFSRGWTMPREDSKCLRRLSVSSASGVSSSHQHGACVLSMPNAVLSQVLWWSSLWWTGHTHICTIRKASPGSSWWTGSTAPCICSLGFLE